MCWLCYANKGKSQRFRKINKKVRGILISQRLSIVIDIHKVVYSNYKSK